MISAIQMIKISLIKITFTLTLLGIFLLLFLSTFQPQKITPISNITSNLLNKQVKVQGQITPQANIEQNKLYIVNIKDSTGEINAIISYSNNAPQLTENQEFIIIGRVQQYKDSLQIQVEEIF